MKYRNIRTGVVIDTPCTVSGGNWVLEDKQTDNTVIINSEEIAPNVSNEVPIENEEQQEQNSTDQDEITKAQIIQELEAFGIEHNPRDKKHVLYDLMMQHGK